MLSFNHKVAPVDDEGRGLQDVDRRASRSSTRGLLRLDFLGLWSLEEDLAPSGKIVVEEVLNEDSDLTMLYLKGFGNLTEDLPFLALPQIRHGKKLKLEGKGRAGPTKRKTWGKSTKKGITLGGEEDEVCHSTWKLLF